MESSTKKLWFINSENEKNSKFQNEIKTEKKQNLN